MITIKKLSIAMLFISAFSVSAAVYASAEGTNQLRLKTSFSKRTGETAFSYLVTWRKGDEPSRDINGLMFTAWRCLWHQEVTMRVSQTRRGGLIS